MAVLAALATVVDVPVERLRGSRCFPDCRATRERLLSIDGASCCSDRAGLLINYRSDIDSLNLALTQLGLVFLFVQARLLPLALLFPVVGGKVIPVRLRIGLAVVVSLMITPLFLSAIELSRPSTWEIIVGTSREALFGLGLALTVMILVGALQLAGSLITQVPG